MIICPECATALPTEAITPAQGIHCGKCGWQQQDHSGVPDFLTQEDRKNEMFQSYVENYDNLAQINLEKSNIDRQFLHNQSKNIIKYLGCIKGQSVCDVGFGQGYLTRELIKASAGMVTSVDVSVSYLATVADTLKVVPVQANAENLPFADEFDIIVSTDVMEHVINVGSFLYCLNRALKPGGTVCIRIPYREGLLNYSPHSGYEHKFGHLRSFNKDLLKIYLRQAGFGNLKFHLDGYSLGSPQEYFYDTTWKKIQYGKLSSWLSKFAKHPADVTMWNSYLNRLIMRPVEIVAIGRKTETP
ncbi:MAG: class I SAM-dependent methyltransferase [Gammaproteobacteria bacterium]|nr:class I SAM-dependent methyltransferase [Gammaproteobacteria bacterium]